MPVGRPPVCPRLILAAFSLAWRSGPVAPAVILRFLGHCHAGSAAKWGGGDEGGESTVVDSAMTAGNDIVGGGGDVTAVVVVCCGLDVT